MSTIDKCPVCGAERENSLSTEYGCEHCSFETAFVTLFSGERQYKLWKEQVEKRRVQHRKEKRAAFAGSRTLVVGGTGIMYRDVKQSRLHIVLGNGQIILENGAVSISSNERNYAICYVNGSVKVFGEDNSYHQKNTEDWSDIKDVLVGDECIYGVKNGGGVVYAGSPLDAQISSWSRIDRLRCSTTIFAGLQTNGRVLVAGEVERSVSDTVGHWTDVSDIAVSRDCIIGLRSDGKVLFAGNAGDAKSGAAAWTDIIAIAADTPYVYGLTVEGKVLLAGNCRAFLDRGRSKASEWEKVIAISCNSSGVGALTEDGSLLFAGSLTGDQSRIHSNWDQSVKLLVTF